MLKHLLVQNSPEFRIEGNYNSSKCAYTNIIDANIIQMALKLPLGWMRFNVLIKDLYITKTNLDPSFNYADIVEPLLKYMDIEVAISQITNKHGVLEGVIHVKNSTNNNLSNVRDILYDLYTPHLIMAKPILKIDSESESESDWDVVSNSEL
jgi:hypothetical protein